MKGLLHIPPLHIYMNNFKYSGGKSGITPFYREHREATEEKIENVGGKSGITPCILEPLGFLNSGVRRVNGKDEI